MKKVLNSPSDSFVARIEPIGIPHGYETPTIASGMAETNQNIAASTKESGRNIRYKEFAFFSEFLPRYFKINKI